MEQYGSRSRSAGLSDVYAYRRADVHARVLRPLHVVALVQANLARQPTLDQSCRLSTRLSTPVRSCCRLGRHWSLFLACWTNLFFVSPLFSPVPARPCPASPPPCSSPQPCLFSFWSSLATLLRPTSSAIPGIRLPRLWHAPLQQRLDRAQLLSLRATHTHSPRPFTPAHLQHSLATQPWSQTCTKTAKRSACRAPVPELLQVGRLADGYFSDQRDVSRCVSPFLSFVSSSFVSRLSSLRLFVLPFFAFLSHSAH